VFLLGSGKEFDICQEIATAANAQKPGNCFNLAGQTNLMQAFALIAYAHRVVSNDSGLMHVAAGLGVSVLPAYILAWVYAAQLVSVPLLTPVVSRAIVAVYTRARPFSMAAQEFLRLFKESAARSAV
jgi:DNA-binding transcriptional LysR family regulator